MMLPCLLQVLGALTCFLCITVAAAKQSYRRLQQEPALAPDPLAGLELASQLGQDRFVLTHHPEAGTYVEIGAYNGKEMSNTYILDRLGWKGTCVEPFPEEWVENNRTCNLIVGVVSGVSGEHVIFKKPQETSLGGVVSTLSNTYSDADAEFINMTTIGIRDLLEQQNVPRHFTYFTLDAEGQEYIILKNFPWCAYTFDILTVEHNHVEPARSYIRELLEANGYVLEHTQSVDDWYLAGPNVRPAAAQQAWRLAAVADPRSEVDVSSTGLAAASGSIVVGATAAIWCSLLVLYWQRHHASKGVSQQLLQLRSP